MNIEYKMTGPLDSSTVSELFARSGIRRPVGDLKRIGRMIEHADELITAWDRDRLVGMLRAVTDYSYCCYISDVAVDRDYQGHGIGRRLIQLLKDKLGEEEIQYVLTSAPKSVGFYEKIGFERADKAFVIKRKVN